MKKLALIMCLAVFSPLHAGDSFDHFAYSAAGSFLGTAYLRLFNVGQFQSVGIAGFTIFAFGVFKELAVDSAVGKKDLLMDGLGAVLGSGIHLVIKF